MRLRVSCRPRCGFTGLALAFLLALCAGEVIADPGANSECRLTNDESQKGAPEVPQFALSTEVRHSTLGLLSSSGIRDSSFFRTVAELGIKAGVVPPVEARILVLQGLPPANSFPIKLIPFAQLYGFCRFL
jgi:hypothetical protein